MAPKGSRSASAGKYIKYKVDKLVYMETYEDVSDVIHREKCVKKWNRSWKIRLIEEINPEWKDLSEGLP